LYGIDFLDQTTHGIGRQYQVADKTWMPLIISHRYQDSPTWREVRFDISTVIDPEWINEVADPITEDGPLKESIVGTPGTGYCFRMKHSSSSNIDFGIEDALIFNED
jgi:hypothetical protein